MWHDVQKDEKPVCLMEENMTEKKNTTVVLLKPMCWAYSLPTPKWRWMGDQPWALMVTTIDTKVTDLDLGTKLRMVYRVLKIIGRI